MTLKTLVLGEHSQLWRFTRISKPEPWPTSAIKVGPQGTQAQTITTSSPSPSAWTLGMYLLVNAHNNAAADLSGQDYKSIIGYSPHGGENQQWVFIPTGNGYAIRSVMIPQRVGEEVYMSVEGKVEENAPVVATTRRTEWNVENSEGNMRYVS